MSKAALSALLLLAAPAAAQQQSFPFAVRETGLAYPSLQDAVDAIGDGQGTILIAPGAYRMCAVQEEGRVSYVAREPGTVIFDGGICEGKAALVLKGRAAAVEGIVFRNLRVADGNGAGIRLQQGDLLVRESLFMDSESGILSHDDPAASIRIEQTTFSGLGRCDRDLDCAHSIYIGDYGSLSIARTRFERGTGGHYVKTRAARIDIADSSFDDSAGRATNYMIDLSNGATGQIVRNAFVQGRDKENYSALIMVAAEGRGHRSSGLLVSDNEAGVAPGFTRRTSFVADRSGEPLRIENNKLSPQIARFEKR
jgi:hypothetical protein